MRNIRKKINIKQAIILVGGLGSRLGRITAKTPKPLIKVNNKPFVEYIIKNLKKTGIKKILFLTSYKSDLFFKKYNNKLIHGIKIHCHNEQGRKGTGGALLSAKKKLDNFFILCNGDTLFDVNLNNMILNFKKTKYMNIGICKKKNLRYSGVKIQNKKIIDFNAKKTPYVNSGYYLISKKILKILKENQFPISLENEIIPTLLKKKKLDFTIFNKSNFLDIGIKSDLKRANNFIKKNQFKRAVFLDRDGVINKDTEYLHKIKDFKWESKVVQTIKYLNDHNFYVFVVSNQSGVGRNYYKERDVYNIQKYIQKTLLKKGAYIDEFFYSFYFKNSKIKEYRKGLNSRKPKIGMYKIAKRKWKFNTNQSFMIGDQNSDLEFGKRAGLKSFNIKKFKNIYSLTKYL